MLHVVPALILLIVQGPAGADRLSCHGRLPAALEALSARMDRTAPRAARAASREAAIASLLALGAKDPRWSTAIANFLQGTGFDALAPASDGTAAVRRGRAAGRLGNAKEPRVPRADFATSSRFRDGPAAG